MSKIELRHSKETENKLRWSKRIEEDQAVFQLYIPKGRVPEPWPGCILVSIDNYEGDLTKCSDMKRFDNLEPINVVIKFVDERTKTFHYQPIGDQRDWQMGEPYIPKNLIRKKPDLLLLRVEWDLNSMGKFLDVPTYREDR